MNKNQTKKIRKSSEDNNEAKNELSNVHLKNIIIENDELKNENNNNNNRPSRGNANLFIFRKNMEKAPFPFRYYFLSQLFDVKSYLILYKQFNILKNSLLDENELHDIESKNKININNRLFLRNINYCIDEHKFSIFTKSVLGDDFSKKSKKSKK